MKPSNSSVILRKPIEAVAAPAVLDDFIDFAATTPCDDINGALNLEKKSSPWRTDEKVGQVWNLQPAAVGGIFGCQAKTDHLVHVTDVDKDLEEIGGLPEGHEYVFEDESFNPYRGISRPRTTHMKRPIHLDYPPTALLTPAQRREQVEYLKRTTKAQTAIRSSDALKGRRHCILGNVFPNGVIGIDSPSNPRSAIYWKRHQAILADRARTAVSRSRRADYIATHTVSTRRRGFDFMEHADRLNPEDQRHKFEEEGRWISRRCRGEFATTPKTTHERIFLSKSAFRIPPFGSRRREKEHRTFNIVTGCPV